MLDCPLSPSYCCHLWHWRCILLKRKVVNKVRNLVQVICRTLILRLESEWVQKVMEYSTCPPPAPPHTHTHDFCCPRVCFPYKWLKSARQRLAEIREILTLAVSEKRPSIWGMMRTQLNMSKRLGAVPVLLHNGCNCYFCNYRFNLHFDEHLEHYLWAT